MIFGQQIGKTIKRCAVVAAAHLLFCFNNSSGQSVTFQHLSIVDGLSHNSVTDVDQDAQGYIWICTQAGLNRYDGRSTKKIDIGRKEAPGCIFIDRSNRFWLGFSNGVSIYYPETGKAIHFDKRNSSLFTRTVDVTQDAHGKIWLGTRRGVFRFEESTSSFTQFIIDKAPGFRDSVEFYWRNRVFQLVSDSKSNLWIGTLGGVYRFSAETYQTERIFFGEDRTIESRAVKSVAFDDTGTLWLGSYFAGGVVAYDTSAKTFQRPAGLQSEEISSLAVNDKGRMVVATKRNGLYICDVAGKTIMRYRNNAFDQSSLASDKATTLFCDKSGMLWIGTERSGVDRLSSLPDKFQRFDYTPGNPNGLPMTDITKVAVSQSGTLWIGTRTGLVSFDRMRNKFETIRGLDSGDNWLIGNDIADLAFDGNGDLWVCTEKGVSCYKPQEKRWKYYRLKYTDGVDQVAYSVLETSWGDLFVGATGGVWRFDKSRGVFVNRKAIRKLEENLIGEFYIDIFEDSKGTVWFATSSHGIFNLDRNLDKVDSFDPSTLPAPVHSFDEDMAGDLWMASSVGAVRLDRKTRKFHVLNSSHGLLTDEVVSIKATSPSEIWVGSPIGLSQVQWSPQSNRAISVRNYTQSDGLAGSLFYSNLEPVGDSLFFYGGVNGFSLFNPYKITFNRQPPVVVVNSFKIFDRDAEIRGSNPVRLNYDDNYFSFEMGALNFDRPQKNRFGYQLLNFDRQVNYTDTRNYGSFTNVPPGEYVLHVIAANNDGFWNNEGYKLKIEIAPPMWRTIWFQAIIGFVLTAGLTVGYRARVRSVQEKEAHRRELLEARLAALKSQVNSHFIFNSLNSINYYISRAQPVVASDYLAKFSKLIRMILENSSFELVSLNKELNMIASYVELEQMRFGMKFDYSVVIDPRIDPAATSVPPMILQPFVENSILHGFATKVGNAELKIEFAFEPPWVICTITDNGVGRSGRNSDDRGHRKMGVSITNTRLNLLAKTKTESPLVEIVDLFDSIGKPAGTKVILKILSV